MKLNQKQFKKAAAEVGKIIFHDGEMNLKEELIKAGEGITDRITKRDFYRHMNALFLNVLLNRLDEIDRDKEPIVMECRYIICELIDNK